MKTYSGTLKNAINVISLVSMTKYLRGKIQDESLALSYHFRGLSSQLFDPIFWVWYHGVGCLWKWGLLTLWGAGSGGIAKIKVKALKRRLYICRKIWSGGFASALYSLGLGILGIAYTSPYGRRRTWHINDSVCSMVSRSCACHSATTNGTSFVFRVNTGENKRVGWNFLPVNIVYSYMCLLWGRRSQRDIVGVLIKHSFLEMGPIRTWDLDGVILLSLLLISTKVTGLCMATPNIFM